MQYFNIIKIVVFCLIFNNHFMMTSFGSNQVFAYPTLHELQIFAQVAACSSNSKMHQAMVTKIQKKEQDLKNPILAYMKHGLLQNGTHIKKNEADFLLTNIIKQGDTVTLECFLNMKTCNFFDINKPFDFFEEKVTPLYLAVYYNKIGVIKMLMNYGASIHKAVNFSLIENVAQPCDIVTPLELAEQKKNKILIEFLRHCDQA